MSAVVNNSASVCSCSSTEPAGARASAPRRRRRPGYGQRALSRFRVIDHSLKVHDQRSCGHHARGAQTPRLQTSTDGRFPFGIRTCVFKPAVRPPIGTQRHEIQVQERQNHAGIHTRLRVNSGWRGQQDCVWARSLGFLSVYLFLMQKRESLTTGKITHCTGVHGGTRRAGRPTNLRRQSRLAICLLEQRMREFDLPRRCYARVAEGEG